MTLALADNVIQDRLQALTRAIDAGAGAGLLKIYDGTRPTTKGAAITTQQLLVTQPFADPSAGSISGTTLTLALGASVLGSKTGQAKWARIVDSAGTFVADMDVVQTSGGPGEVLLTTTSGQTTQIYEGGVVAVSVATLVEA
ncbi:hypothetical protein [Cupriavidus necator]|uniref:hypothetical protein n=1 Tax=Cupriavidus necator TaxID=106590 RepID=UPI00339D33CA